MIRVSFKASIDFSDEDWGKFKSQWTMPPVLLHSTIKSAVLEGFKSQYGLEPDAVGIFPPDEKSKVEPENVL